MLSPPVSRGTTIILCTDDNRFGLAIRKQMLQAQSYSVLTADNGPSGFRVLSDFPVDAVVLDFKIAGMDGLAVATAIRERHGKFPIVLLSGYPAELPKQLSEMVDACVTKGHSPQMLLEELRRVTGGAKKPPTKDIAARAKDHLNKQSG